MFKLNPEIFRAYDIRGVYGKDFDGDFAFKLGAVLVRYLNRKRFLVANDSRDFSPGLAKSLMKGITNAGGDVDYIGGSTIPFFYFAFRELGVNGGVMITASHNKPEYGGFKIFGENCEPIDSNSGLGVIRDLAVGNNLEASKYGGRVYEPDGQEILEKYAKFIVKKSGFRVGDIGDLRVRVNGNQIAMREIDLLFGKLGIENCDGNFDIAFSLDEDADRLAVFDRDYNKISPDFVLGLLVKEEIGFFLKPRVVYDLRLSKGVLGRFKEWGIKSFRSRVGRTFLREEAVKRRADLGGELSGHLLFKKNDYFELPLMAALKILKALRKGGEDINGLVKPFKTWFNSGEINTAFSGEHLAFGEILERLKEKYRDGKIDELDGITVEYPDPEKSPDGDCGASWWFNLRPSNTEPVIRLVVEARSKESLDRRVRELTEIIKAAH